MCTDMAKYQFWVLLIFGPVFKNRHDSIKEILSAKYKEYKESIQFQFMTSGDAGQTSAVSRQRSQSRRV